jgi:hypothetical protein
MRRLVCVREIEIEARMHVHAAHSVTTYPVNLGCCGGAACRVRGSWLIKVFVFLVSGVWLRGCGVLLCAALCAAHLRH